MQDTSPTENSSPDPTVNILLVDDQPANLLALRAILQDLGHNLVEAHSAEEARTLLGTDDFAVILLDIQMNGLDGFETAKLIRSQERSRYTPIIFHTAPESNRLPVEEQAYALGAVDYLVKPLVPFILRAKVAWFVELFQKTGRAERQAEAARQTERSGFEEALAHERTRLREQQEWLRVTLGSIGDAVIATDPAGRVAFLNPVAQSLTGWTQQEAEGQLLETVFPLIHEETRRPLEHPLAKVIGEGAIANLGDHAVLVARDGTERPIDDSAAPIKDGEGNITGMLLTFRDVSERRRAEVRLREEIRKTQEAEERLRMMVESVKDYALFSLDVQGRIVSWNTGAEHLLGYGEEEVLGKHFSIFFTPEDNRGRQARPGVAARRRPKGVRATTTGPSARTVPAFGRKDRRTLCGTGNCGATSRSSVTSPSGSRWRRSCVPGPKRWWKRTGGGTSSWRCSAMNFGTPWPRL